MIVLPQSLFIAKSLHTHKLHTLINKTIFWIIRINKNLSRMGSTRTHSSSRVPYRKNPLLAWGVQHT